MAIRFKNGGTGQTADGAILAANPDEFQEALNYVDSSSTGVNHKYIELEADLDLNYSANWYYKMKDIFNINTLRTDSTSYNDKRIIINGKGHSITNIYVYPNCAVFGSNYDGVQTGSIVGIVLEINDVTFEAIIQKGGGFFNGTSRQDWPEKRTYYCWLCPKTNGCIFNIKFDNSYDIGNNYMHLFDYYSNIYFNTGYNYPRAVNCIFNIYISAAAENHRPLFKVNSQSASDFGNMTIFESCEFRIRNNTDKLLCIFHMMANYKFLIDNCAFFLADIKQYDDPTKRTSSLYDQNFGIGTSTRHAMGRYDTGYIGYLKALFYNSYVAAFGNDFNSGSNDPIYISMDPTDTNIIIPATSFYDKNKIFMTWDASTTQETTGFSALTTAQCKDKTALSNIGYLFAEEV